MKILICGLLWFHLVFSAPQISPLDEASGLDDLYSDTYPNSHSSKDKIPDYDEEESSNYDINKIPEIELPLKRSYGLGQNDDDGSNTWSNIKTYEGPESRKGSYKMVQDGGVIGTNKNYRLIMRQSYKIQEPIRYNVSRIVKKTKVLRTRPIVRKIYRTRYYKGYKNPEDGLAKMYYTGGKYNETGEDFPHSAESESGLVDENVKIDKYYDTSDRTHPENYDNELKSPKQPNYNSLELLKQNDDHLMLPQDILSNTQYDHSYAYPIRPKSSNYIINSDSDSINNYKKGHNVQVLNTKFSPDLLNTDYEYNIQSGKSVTGKDYGSHLYQDSQTINDNGGKVIEKASQVSTLLSTKNHNVLDVDSTPNKFLPDLAEFGKRLLQFNNFLDNNLQKGKKKGLKTSNTKHDKTGYASLSTESPIYTIKYATAVDEEKLQSIELNNENISETVDLTRSRIPISLASIDEVISTKTYKPELKNNNVEMKAHKNWNLKWSTTAIPFASSEDEDFLSAEIDLTKLRENAPKDEDISQPFNQKFSAQPLEVKENLDKYRAEITQNLIHQISKLDKTKTELTDEAYEKLPDHTLANTDLGTSQLSKLEESQRQKVDENHADHILGNENLTLPGGDEGRIHETMDHSGQISNEEETRSGLGKYLGKIDENSLSQLLKVQDSRPDNRQNLDKTDGSSTLTLEKVYEIRSGPSMILDDTDENSKDLRSGPGKTFERKTSPSGALKKVPEVRFGPVRILNEEDDSPGNTSKESQPLEKVSEISSGPDKISEENPNNKINENLSLKSQKAYDISLVHGENKENKGKSSGSGNNFTGVVEIPRELVKVSKIPSVQTLVQLDGSLKQTIEEKYDIHSHPSEVKASLFGQTLVAHVNRSAVTEEDGKKLLPLKITGSNIETENLSGDKNMPHVLVETEELNNEQLEPEHDSNNFESARKLPPFELDENYEKADENNLRYFPHPLYIQHVEPAESGERNVELFPIDPHEYVGLNANEGLNYPGVDYLRTEQFSYAPDNLPWQYHPAKKNNVNNAINNDNDDKTDDLIKLCKLARTNLKKLRILVARNYGLNTKTAEENDLITIVYIMGTLNEARKTDMPVEIIVDDFLVNLRRLGVLRKLLCKDIEETDHTIDFNFEDNIENIDDINFDINILTLFDKFLLHKGKKLPRYHELHLSKTTFEHNKDDIKQNSYTTSPVYGDTDMKNLYAVTPDFVKSTESNLYSMQDHEKNMNQNINKIQLHNVEHTSQQAYTARPDYKKTPNQILSVSRDLERSNPVQPSNLEKTHQNVYTHLPYYTEYVDQNEYVINQNMYPVRTDYLEKTDQDEFDIESQYTKTNDNLYTKQSDYTDYKEQNLYSSTPNYLKTSKQNMYTVKTSYVENSSDKLYTNQPDYKEYVDQNLYTKQPDSTDYIDRNVYANNQNKAPVIPEHVERTDRNVFNFETEYAENTNENVYTNHPVYNDNIARNMYTLRPNNKENVKQNAYSGQLSYVKNSDNKLYTNQPDYKYTDQFAYAINQKLYPVRPIYVDNTDDQNVYKIVQEYTENTNNDLYTNQPEFTFNNAQNLYSIIQDSVKNTQQNIYTRKPASVENLKTKLYTKQPEPMEYKDETLLDSTEYIDESFYTMKQNMYPLSLDYMERTTKNSFNKRDWENINKPIYQNPPDTTRNIDQNMYPLKHDLVRNKGENLYTVEPQYIKYTNEHLYTDQPDHTYNIDQKVYSVNPNKYPVRSGYVEKTNPHLYTIEPDYQEETNKDFYTKHPDYKDNIDYMEIAGEYLYKIKPNNIRNTEQNMFTFEPEYVENTHENMYTNEPYTENTPQNLNPIIPGYMGNTNQNYPIKSAKRERGSVTFTNIGNGPSEIKATDVQYEIPKRERGSVTFTNIGNGPSETKATDVQYEIPKTQQEHPFTNGVKQKSYITPPYYTFTRSPSKSDRELDFDDGTITTAKSTPDVISTTPLPYADKDSYYVNNAEIKGDKLALDLKDDLISVNKPLMGKIKSYDHEGTSAEDYQQLLEGLKQYEYEYEQADNPRNEHSLNFNILNQKQPYNYWNYKDNWLKTYFGKSLKKPGHLNVYLDDKKLYFWPDNANQSVNEAHNIRIKGYLQKIDVESLVTVAHYQSVNYDNELVPTKELSLLLEVRDKIDISIVTNVIWHEILRLRMIGVSEGKISQFVYKLVVTAVPYIFKDTHKCHNEMLRHLLLSIKNLEFGGL